MAVGGPGLGPSREGRPRLRPRPPGSHPALASAGVAAAAAVAAGCWEPHFPPLPGAAWPRGGLATSGNEREHSSEGHTKNFYSSVHYVNLSSPVSAWRRQTLRCSLRRGKRRGDRGDRPTSQDSNRVVVFP